MEYYLENIYGIGLLIQIKLSCRKYSIDYRILLIFFRVIFSIHMVSIDSLESTSKPTLTSKCMSGNFLKDSNNQFNCIKIYYIYTQLMVSMCAVEILWLPWILGNWVLSQMLDSSLMSKIVGQRLYLTQSNQFPIKWILFWLLPISIMSIFWVIIFPFIQKLLG